jgi:RNA polymerase sigma-70 factor (ECF subfamily)
MTAEEDRAALQGLLDRLAAGDAEAADRLIERSVQRLRRLAHFMLRNQPKLRRWYETDDVFQAAAIRLHRALKSVRPSSPRDFLNLAATQIRRELCDLTRHEYGPEGEAAHHATAPPEAQGDRTQDRCGQEAADAAAGPATQARCHDLLRHVQEVLPQEEREVFDLLFIQELSQEEAAQLLNVSVPTVKRRWRSARLLLHQTGFGDASLRE